MFSSGREGLMEWLGFHAYLEDLLDLSGEYRNLTLLQFMNIFIHSTINVFVCSSLIKSLTHALIHPLFMYLLIQPFIHPWIYPSVFMHSVVD